MPLQPPIDTLGIAAPYLGPWFDDVNLRLAVPDGNPNDIDLSVPLTLTTASTRWLPPATGTLSLHVSSTERPAGLKRLRRPDGRAAFNEDRLIAVFSLLPEVAERLHALTRFIAPADGTTGGTAGSAPGRAFVACLALEFPDNNFAQLGTLLPSPLVDNPGMSNADLATYFGLRFNADDNTLANDTRPMTVLRQPGLIPIVGDFEAMIALPLALSGLCRLHAFDQRGRPLDPGAVAAWWAALAGRFSDMWAFGLGGLLGNAADRRTVPVDGGLSGQLVSAHEGKVDAVLMARVDRAAAGISEVEQDGLFSHQAGTPALVVQFTPLTGPSVRDDAPVPRAVVMPSGRCGAQLKLWDTAASTPVARDFVRVAVVELEEHLVGVKRTVPPDHTAAQANRADNQQRWTTRVNIAQSQGPALLTTVDDAARAVLGLVNGQSSQVVCGSMDTGWGPLNGLPTAVTPPDLSAVQVNMQVRPLFGGNADADAQPQRGQRVLLQFTGLVTAQANFAGCWLRAWPVGFDLRTGERPVLTGGAALVDVAGTANLVVELPDGAGSGLLGVRLALTAPGGFTRDITEQRFARPGEVGAVSAGLSWGGNGALQVLLCEQGQQLTLVAAPGASLLGVLLPGTTVVEVVPGGFALIDPATIPDNAFAAPTAATSFGPGDTLELTQPAFKAMPDGTVGLNGGATWLTEILGVGAATWRGAVLNRVVRNGVLPLINDSQPFATQERMDNAAASRSASLACVWTAPALARYHQVGAHNTGHPGAPAAVEVHGTGVTLNGPAAHLVADHTDGRIQKIAPDLVTAATNAAAVPAAAATDNLWVAVLKTVAATVEGDRNLGSQNFGDTVISAGTPVEAYTFEPADPPAPGVATRAYQSTPAQATDIKKWYDDHFVITEPKTGFDIKGTRLPADTGWAPARVNQAKRAMDRRALEAGWGLRETLHSVAAAIGRAEDFIYIETPALDQAAIGPDAEILLGKLMLRLTENPLLHLLLCLPARLMPGWPQGIEKQRNLNLRNAIGALQMFGGDRVAVFSPSAGQGRDVRLTATTVIVDDAYALTGSTHLWRRGLSFDSSLAVALFDEVLQGGRPSEIVNFRRALIAQQLSLPALRVPDDPAALVHLVQQYNQMRSGRVGHTPLQLPKLDAPAAGGWQPDDGWNPDGSYRPGANVLELLYQFLQGNEHELN